MLALTHQRICPLHKTCYYPNIKSQLFLRCGEACNNGYRCSVESSMDEGHFIAMLENADSAESNAKRLLLSWYCGCRRCRLGYAELCYARKGPNRELRSIFRERWRLQQIRDGRRNTRKAQANQPLTMPLQYLPLFPDDHGQEMFLSPSAVLVQ
jgi:hypothetical protein